ncbi:MAG: PA14 domain-containing protein, partial [Flavihumibacter sp.]
MSISTRRFVLRLIASIAIWLTAADSALLAQSVLDPADPIVEYNSATPPAVPAYNVIGKWARTRKLAWNTEDYKAYYLNGFPFRLKYPKTYAPGVADGKKYPLLVMLHGKSESGPASDNESQIFNGGQVFLSAVNDGVFDGYVLFLQNPQTFWGNSQFLVINRIIDYMVANNKLDIDRVIIHGVSAGGTGAWNYVDTFIKNVAAAIPMSAAAASNASATAVDSYKFTPIWLFQGGQDQNPRPATADAVNTAATAQGANFKYTLYPNTGHNTWYEAYTEADFFPFINRAHKANPYALFKKTEYCEGDPVNTTLGLTAGFDEYQWSKDGATIAGATTNTLNVTQAGTYAARFRRGSAWSVWSPMPVVVKTVPRPAGPVISLVNPQSAVIPSPDGKTQVLLTVSGDSTANYQWTKGSDATVLGVKSTFTATAAGSYYVKLVTATGCVSQSSAAFVIGATNGANKPPAPTSLQATVTPASAIQLQWLQNAAPAFNETGFEVYRSLTPGGPYTFIGLTTADASGYLDSTTAPGQPYSYVVRAVNATAASAVSNEVTIQSAADVTPPTAPQTLAVQGSTSTSITVAWQAATDNIGVDHYDVYVNNVKMPSVTDLTYTATGLTRNTAYVFSVVAVDRAGNQSVKSNEVTAFAVTKGLKYKYYSGTFLKLPDFSTTVVVDSGQVNNVTLAPRKSDDNFAFLWEGYIWIPAGGSYTFRTNSDDGSKFYLSPYSSSATALVNNDGIHGAQDRDSTVTLTAGIYPVAISYFNRSGGRSMNLSWKTPQTASAFTAIPDSV